MSKTLVLKARFPTGNHAAWHDYFPVMEALRKIVGDKTPNKKPMWWIVSAKLTEAGEKAKLSALVDESGKVWERQPKRGEVPDDWEFYKNFNDFSIDLTNTQARLLWQELLVLTPKDFGVMPDGKSISPGAIWIMLSDFAKQLGEKLPEEDADDDQAEDQSDRLPRVP